MVRNLYSLLLLFILTIQLGFGQVTKGVVHYTVNINTFVERITNSDANDITKNMYIEAGKAMDNISFTLRFDEEKAFFEKDKNLAIDGSEKANQMAAILSSQGSYYTDLTARKQLLVRDFQGKTFNVPSSIPDREWELTKETKMIGKFTCYKAKMTITTDSGSFPVIAWYCPEIPVSMGPNDFVGNLPGLILELHDTAISFSCSSLTLNPEESLNIEWPKDLDITSQEEYRKAGEDIKRKVKPNN